MPCAPPPAARRQVSLIVTGQTYISSGLASILNATTPLFTVLMMAAAGDEKLHARRVAGVVIGLTGVAILHGQDLGFGSGQGFGILLCLAGAFSYSLSALYARRKLSASPPLATATFQMLAFTVMMTVIAGVFIGAVVIGSALLVIDGRALNLGRGAASIPKASR